MTDLRKAAEQALDALKDTHYRIIGAGLLDQDLLDRNFTVATALRQALAQSEQEPVAWADKVGAVIPHSHKLFQPDLLKDYTRPLYTAPVDAVNISEERVDETAKGEHEPVAWVIEDGEVDYYVDVVAKIKPGTPLYTAPPQKRSFSEDMGRLLSTNKGFYDDGTPIDPKEINMKIEGVGDGVVTCTEVHLPRPPQKEWVGLTDEEKGWCGAPTLQETVARVEVKLKEKNT